ncbi:3-isopropylmalate dehydratase small subunit [Methanonatronarchaeum sp. AMET6-2]|uniref:3-isopropylmalate dehydratase small subunit n=1 Tax=Methanonatronarchaeum sp. AMET6-2 TaxID=2933293 RepID=UPI00122AB61B|nr:3-isopropylmalate dehydratase small subunit [Methanonatronarchaeum sp. AMET6-2]RZN62333.1 MAG: 3-isopropylmalate dehydratase small subunit [Methanonatronarchaeia archaeon]UOY09570.1 3-isopropylmalate dehydratase small subunit [Methanonatronarchaeum sp. AMET6-2]
MNFEGTARTYGDDVDTDAIIPGKYKFDTLDMNKLARHAMEGIDPDFYERIDEGDIIVAGENFGCGSSREQAPLVIKHSGISCVVAESFARIFFRNAINVGLPIIKISGISSKVDEGDELKVDVENGVLENLSKNESYEGEELSEFMLIVLGEGGLPNYIKNRGDFVWPTK